MREELKLKSPLLGTLHPALHSACHTKLENPILHVPIKMGCVFALKSWC
jgi:hypothetical protein